MSGRTAETRDDGGTVIACANLAGFGDETVADALRRIPT
jgi:hypothetical protein